jgi:hypothetical protein
MRIVEQVEPGEAVLHRLEAVDDGEVEIAGPDRAKRRLGLELAQLELDVRVRVRICRDGPRQERRPRGEEASEAKRAPLASAHLGELALDHCRTSEEVLRVAEDDLAGHG